MFDIIITFALLASAITASKLALHAVEPSVLVAIRMLVGGLIIGALAFWRGRGDLLARVRRHWWQLILLAILATFIPAMLKAYALKHTLSSKVSLIGSLDPFVTALYCYVLFGQKLNMRRWLGICLAVAGICILIVVPTVSEGRSFLGPLSYAELAALAHVFLSRGGWLKIQLMLKSGVFSPLEINGVLMACAGFLGLATALIFEPSACAHIFCLDARTVWLLLYACVAANLVGYTMYSAMLKKYSPTLMSLAGFLTPLFVYGLGWPVLGEQPYASFAVAAVIVFAGLVLFYTGEGKQVRQVPEEGV